MRPLAPSTVLAAALSIGVLGTLPVPAAAQAAASVAPTLIPLSGELRTPDGQPRTGNVILVISLYEGRDDSAPRWIEHQAVTLDAAGRFSVNFGGTRDEGLPTDLFAGAAGTRWVGVGVENETEQPRVALVSVPYAAKAVSADTLSGKSLTDFVLTSTLHDDVRAVLQEEGGSATAAAVEGSLNYLQKGDGAAGTTDSIVFESAGKIGIGTITPTALLDVAGNTLTGEGVLTLEAGGRVTTQAGNDLHIVAPNSRSIFFRIGSPDNPRVEIDNIGRLGLGLAGGAPTALFDASGTTISFDGIVSLEPGGRLTTRPGNDLNIDTPAARSLFIRNGGTPRMTVDGAGNVGIGTSTPGAKLHVLGDVIVDGNIGAKYQDVAEWVPAVEALDAGSVVVIDLLSSNHVRAASGAYSTAVIGAVSAQPGLILGEPGEGKVLVAQSGRVRVKADATFGAIKRGDLLVTSPTKGHVMRSSPVKLGQTLMHRPGTLVGKALEALPNGRGEILVLLTLQ